MRIKPTGNLQRFCRGPIPAINWLSDNLRENNARTLPPRLLGLRRKVRITLDEKNIPWKGHYIDTLKGEQFHPDYAKLNPKCVVPTVVHDGQVIRESTVICEYLEEVFTDVRLFPSEPLRRAGGPNLVQSY